MILSHSPRLPCLVALAACSLALVGCGSATTIQPSAKAEVPDPVRLPEPPVGPPVYRDVTAGSGIDFTGRTGAEANRFTILESLGSGVALLDYDGDGRLDVFVAGGGYFAGGVKPEIKGHSCKLYKNLGDWKFRNVTREAGLECEWFYSHGVAVADYDRDGWPDLLITGYGRVALFHNEPGEGGTRRFVDVTEKVGLKDESWATGAGFADLDGDGFPDLYVCHYVDWSFANDPVCMGQVLGVARDVCPPQRFKPLVHALFKNEGGKAFRNVSADHGFQAAGCGLGVVLVDVNDDGRPDVYVANDASNNFLFMNRGGKLEEKGLAAGVATDDAGRFNGSMGVDAADYDGSGRASLWVTNFQGDLHALYQNLGREVFNHQSRATGIPAVGSHLVGFGTAFTDFDGDGWEDLVFVNGHVLQHPILGSTFRQRPVLMRNVERSGRRFFMDFTSRGGDYFKTPTLGRGLAVGDLDNDGWPDLVVTHSDTPVALLRNVAGEGVLAGRWLGTRLVGKGGRDVVGSIVIVETATRKLTRFCKGGGSYLSANDPRLLFGLGDGTSVRRVTVKWSWGASQTWENLVSGAYWELVEGEPAARRMTAPN